MIKVFKKILYGLAVIMLLVTTGCGAQIESGYLTELVIAQSADAVSLDPHATNDSRSALVNKHIYETLVVQDEELNLKPGLAKSWEVIDERTYEFALQEGVYFHNGALFTASDVKFTLLRALESPNVFPIAGVIDGESITIFDDYTIRIATVEPFAPLLAHLAHTAMSILNEQAVTEAGDDYGQNPVGTGRYIFEEWILGECITLTRNDDYFGELAKIENLTIRTISEASNRLIELETGQVDIALDIIPSNIERLEEHEDLVLHRKADLRTNYMGFNLEKEPFHDVRIRQAINYAIDVELIVDTILEGVGGVATGPIGLSVWGANPNLPGYEYNPERAQELLTEAGYSEGFKTTLWIDDDATRVNIATIVSNQLAKIGIDVEIKGMEWGAYLEHLAEGKHELFILGWTAVTADADYGLYPLFHSSQFGASGNRTFYANDRVDELLTAGRTTTDQDQRLEYYLEAQEIIVEDAPWVFLNVGETLIGARRHVNGFNINPSGHHTFYGVYFD